MLVLAYWSGQTDLALCSLYMAESECCTNPVSAVIRTASKQLQLHDELGNLSVNVYMLLMVSRFGQVELAACARLYQVLHKPCACSSTTASRQQQRAATEQFQPHIMQAFASTPIRMCWFSQTDLAACCILHLAVWACCTNLCMQQQQQPADSRIQKSLQLHSLSSVMCPCKLVYICLLVPV
jgi:hypothetical protein